MKRLLLGLLFSLLWVQYSAATAANVPEQLRLSLGFNESTEMVISWLSSSEKGCVEYGIWGNDALLVSHSRTWSSSGGETSGLRYVHQVHLRDLLPGTVYRYRARSSCGPDDDLLSASAVHAFRTRPVDGTGTVAVFADQGTWGGAALFTEWIRSAQLGVDLALHLGDLSYGTEEGVWNEWGRRAEPLTAELPYMVIPGNWDVKEHSQALFQARFAGPLLVREAAGPAAWSPLVHQFYAFDFASARFLMLNTYEDYGPGSAQRAWLERELERANEPAQRRRRPFVIVCAHSPMYSSSSGHGGGDQALADALEELLLRGRVDLYLSGHDHGYERTLPVARGRVVSQEPQRYASPPPAPLHVLVGTGGATFDPWLQPASPWSFRRELSIGFTRLRFFPNNTLRVDFVRANHSAAALNRLPEPDLFWLVAAPPAASSSSSPDASSPALLDRHAQLLFLALFVLVPFFFYALLYRRSAAAAAAPSVLPFLRSSSQLSVAKANGVHGLGVGFSRKL